MVSVRAARMDDVPEIARIHVDTWRTTYRGIVPEAFLAKLSYERREAQWRSALEQPVSGSYLLVATLGQAGEGSVVGFACGGANRDKALPFSGELHAIYLRQACQGQGIGYALFRRSVESLRGAGFDSMVIWALEANPACRFYERQGGRPAAEKWEEIGGAKLREVGYGWPCLGGEGAMEVQRVRSGAPWEEQIAYSRAVRAGSTVQVSGTAPVGADGKVVGPGDGYVQAKRCLEIIEAALAKLGVPMRAVVRTRMYVTDISRWADYGRAHREAFAAFPPATSMVEVKALIDPAMLIEIEAEAQCS